MSQDLRSLLGNRLDPLEVDRDEQREPWTRAIIPALIGGVNSQLPGDLINSSECIRMDNMTNRSGRLRIDTGYVAYGALIGSRSAPERPKGTYEHANSDGAKTILCVSDTTVYKYSATHERWHVVYGVANSTLAGIAGSETATIQVVDDTNYVVGEVIGIELDSGDQHVTTIATKPGANILTLDDTMLAGDTAQVGNTVFQGPALAGDNDNQVVFEPFPATQWTTFTNGVGKPQFYQNADGTERVQTITNLPSTITTCKTLALYYDALLLLNITENTPTLEKPYLIQWCDPGDPTNWTTGNSGNNSLLSSRDHIIGAKKIGPSLAVIRDNSILRMDFRGQLGAYFTFTDTINGSEEGSQPVGAVSPNAMFEIPGAIIVLSKDGLYLYRGGYEINLISTRVFENMFSAYGDFNKSLSHTAFMQFIDQYNELFIFYADNDATLFPNKALVFNVERNTFRFRTWLEEMICAGIHDVNPPGQTINDLVGTIDEQTFSLGGSAASGNVPNIILGSSDGTRTYDYDYLASDDNGSAIEIHVETKDIDGTDRELTHDWVEVEGSSAGELRTSISTDRGASALEIGSNMTANLTHQRYHHVLTGRRWRYIFTGNGPNTEIGKIIVKYKESTPT